MLELTADNAHGYLRDRGRIPPGPAQVECLGGGVSNAVFRIEDSCGGFVLKQSRPQLRTRDTWLSDIDRVFREQEVMQVLHPLLPDGVVPAVLWSDRDNYVFAMTAAPRQARVWKQSLLNGDVDLNLGEKAGSILGRMHEVTANRPALVEPFADRAVYVQLRVDPFYRRVQERRPEVAASIAPIIDRMLTDKVALCHGDYTPKNMLIHDHAITLVDYETAHFGDPTMDLGLFLCHLILKSYKHDRQREAFFGLTRAFWKGYERERSLETLRAVEPFAVEHMAVCLLARIDGTSPVDYLPEEPKREAVRNLARHLLWEKVTQWAEVLERIDQKT